MGRRAQAIISGLCIALLTLSLTVAYAQDGDATTYEGTHDAGGTIRFTVSPQGTQIRSLSLEGIAGGGCTWDTIDIANWRGPIGVTENRFEATNADGDVIRGEFPAPFRAEGTIEVTDPARGCSSGPLRWSAKAPEPTRAATSVQQQPAPQPSMSMPAEEEPPASSISMSPSTATASPGRDDNAGKSNSAPGAAHCGPGERPAYRQSLAVLADRLGPTMGQAVECEHLNNANGDTLQQTSRGLAYFRWRTGLPTFTDGWKHWALRGSELVEWEGESPDAP